MTEKLKVIVRGKTEVFLEKDCVSVSLVNDLGPFDILPEHANFVANFLGAVVVRDTGGKQWRKERARGVVRVVSNVVDVVVLEE